ncbi:MAG: hypothetical protein ACR2JF_01515 [Iamia sp.]
MGTNRPRGHAAIKTMATEMGTTMPELLVLARANDPFCAGTPADQQAGAWFAQLWTQHGGGGHLRRLHYALVSTGAVQMDWHAVREHRAVLAEAEQRLVDGAGHGPGRPDFPG